MTLVFLATPAARPVPRLLTRRVLEMLWCLKPERFRVLTSKFDRWMQRSRFGYKTHEARRGETPARRLCEAAMKNNATGTATNKKLSDTAPDLPTAMNGVKIICAYRGAKTVCQDMPAAGPRPAMESPSASEYAASFAVSISEKTRIKSEGKHAMNMIQRSRPRWARSFK